MTGRTQTAGARATRNDPSDMMGRILDFPNQLRGAFELARSGPDLLAGHRPLRVFVVGMGGSAIGGDFLRAFAEIGASTPVEVVRGYRLPASADASSFAFFVSYSGNTEETLSGWAEAVERGIPRGCVTSGGTLGRRASEGGVPTLSIPTGSPPRAALGWTSVPLFVALDRAGVLAFSEEDLAEAARACEDVIATYGPDAPGDNALRGWAERAAHRFPMIYAPAWTYSAVATRWACQLNENGKVLAHFALFPEQNHNEIVGWETASPAREAAEVAFLADDDVHPRVRKRMELVAEVAEAAGARATWFRPEGRGPLARLYSLSTMGDLASVYVAGEKGVDPTPVESIDRLKAELAKEPNS